MNLARQHMPLVMDEVDARLVSLLRHDGRTPYRTMALELNLTEATVRTRVRRLEESNLMRVVAVTDFEAAGYNMMLAIGIVVEDSSPTEVALQLADIPEVFSVNVVVGTHDIQTLVVTRDLDTLGTLISHTLATLPGVRKVIPSLAVNVLKNQPSWVPFHDEPWAGQWAQGEVSQDRTSGKRPLDPVDRNIMEWLSRDARISNRKIAAELGVTEGTVRGRIKRMEEEQLIRITAVTNIEYFDNPSLGYISIGLERSSEAEDVARALAARPEIGFVGIMLGRFDILAITMVQSNNELAGFVHEHISSIAGVRTTESTLGVKFVKHDYRLSRILAQGRI